jgi:hypothetical protein
MTGLGQFIKGGNIAERTDVPLYVTKGLISRY